MASAFDDFVNRKSSEAQKFDREGRITNYREKINDLNIIIKKFLSGFIEKGTIRVDHRSEHIREELLGEYQVDALDIWIGETKVELRPVGTILLGGIGRADLIGSGEPIMIVLTLPEVDRPEIRFVTSTQSSTPSPPIVWSEWVWKIAVRRPTLSYVDLTKDSFQGALMQVAS